jgi:hypothetical protein
VSRGRGVAPWLGPPRPGRDCNQPRKTGFTGRIRYADEFWRIDGEDVDEDEAKKLLTEAEWEALWPLREMVQADWDDYRRDMGLGEYADLSRACTSHLDAGSGRMPGRRRPGAHLEH